MIRFDKTIDMYKILFLFLFFASYTQAQLVSGTLLEEGRKMVSDINYIQEGTIDGWAIFKLAVDREGNVTSATLQDANFNRTSAKVQLRNYLMKLKFEPGTYYPKFHHVNIKMTLVKPIPEDQE